MGKISKLLLNALAIASVKAQDFEVTDCSNDNVSTSIWDLKVFNQDNGIKTPHSVVKITYWMSRR